MPPAICASGQEPDIGASLAPQWQSHVIVTHSLSNAIVVPRYFSSLGAIIPYSSSTAGLLMHSPACKDRPVPCVWKAWKPHGAHSSTWRVSLTSSCLYECQQECLDTVHAKGEAHQDPLRLLRLQTFK